MTPVEERELFEAPELFVATPLQTTYPDNIPVAVHGMPATMVGWDADTRIVEEAAGIGFGLAVGRSATNEKRIVLNAAVPVGVTYRDITLIATATVVDVYPQYANAGVCYRGDIWLKSTVAINALVDPVTYAQATGIIGKAAVAAGIIAIPGARWMRGCAANGFALLRLEF
jgi:hypothetical protein